MLNTVKSWLKEDYNGGMDTTFGDWDLTIFNENGNIVVALYDWENLQEAFSVIAGRRILEMDTETELDQYLCTILAYNTNDMEGDYD